MKNIGTYFLIIALLLIPSVITAQNKTTNIAVNTKFTLKVTPLGNGKYSYTVEKTEPFTKVLDMNSLSSLFSDPVETNKIEGIIAYSTFAGSKNATLAIKSGLDKPISYTLMIKEDKKEQLEKTSVSNLFSNTVSTEIWPLNVSYIVISDFTDM